MEMCGDPSSYSLSLLLGKSFVTLLWGLGQCPTYIGVTHPFSVVLGRGGFPWSSWIASSEVEPPACELGLIIAFFSQPAMPVVNL